MTALLTLVVAAGGKVIHKVAEEVMELQEKQRLGFRDECKGGGAPDQPHPRGPWAEDRVRVTPPPIPRTLTWSCCPAYSMDWKMRQVQCRLISRRAM